MPGREVKPAGHGVEPLRRVVVRERNRQPDLANSEQVAQGVEVLDPIQPPGQAPAHGLGRDRVQPLLNRFRKPLPLGC